MAKEQKRNKYNLRKRKLEKLNVNLEKLSLGLEAFFEEAEEKLKDAKKAPPSEKLT